MQLLNSYGISRSELRVILDKKEQNLHQVACLRLFESTYKNGVAENVGNHPNSFFTSAVAYEKATKKAEKQKEQRAANATANTNANSNAPATVQHPEAGSGSPAAPEPTANNDTEMAAE